MNVIIHEFNIFALFPTFLILRAKILEIILKYFSKISTKVISVDHMTAGEPEKAKAAVNSALIYFPKEK